VNRTAAARVLVSMAVVGHQLGAAERATAQAWVPSQGEGMVTVTYQNYYTLGHFDRQGRETPNGATHSKALIAELNYGVTDTIGVAISLPFIASKYTGPRPSYFVGAFETFPGPLDDGSYHGAFQDVRVEVRRAFLAGPVTTTPFVGAAFPTHRYQTIGEAVPGRHRRELQLGANAGVLLDELFRSTYAHARYMYTAAEREQDLPYRRSNVDLEVGSSATSRVGLRALASWQFAHDAPTVEQLAPIWPIHDRFIVPNYLQAGAGASIELTRTTEVHALWIAAVSGRGGAHIARVLSLGVTWRFGGGLGYLKNSSSESNRPVEVSGK
jgi:hypothetical protein